MCGCCEHQNKLQAQNRLSNIEIGVDDYEIECDHNYKSRCVHQEAVITVINGTTDIKFKTTK